MSGADAFGTVRHGIVLFTERFEACVAFYRDTLGLDVWYEKDALVCFRFAGGYLMVETSGRAVDGIKSRQDGPAMIRLDVADVAAAAEILRERGVETEVETHDWGTIALFADPDGNRVQLKNADDPFHA